MSAAAVPDAPYHAPEEDPRPVVALPRAGLPGAVIALIAVASALLLFVILNGQRRSDVATTSRTDRLQQNAFGPAPTLVVPPEPASAPPPQPVIVTTPAPTPPPIRLIAPPASQSSPVITPIIPSPAAPIILAPVGAPRNRSSEQALVYDGGTERGAGGAPTEQPVQSGGRQGIAGGTSGDAPVRATTIANRTTLMPTGTIIPAVLETPIDTARPGLLRAIISEDARGFDGRRVLVPRGSRLVGEYQAEVRPNQNRVLVTWTRLIRPDGVAIRLDSPAADPLGGAGVPGQLHTYFLQRFASAVLQSALQVGVNLASRPGNGSVIVGLPGTTVNNVVGQGTQQSSGIQPKVTVKQGASINVFVARDLDFSGVPSRP